MASIASPSSVISASSLAFKLDVPTSMIHTTYQRRPLLPSFLVFLTMSTQLNINVKEGKKEYAFGNLNQLVDDYKTDGNVGKSVVVM